MATNTTQMSLGNYKFLIRIGVLVFVIVICTFANAQPIKYSQALLFDEWISFSQGSETTLEIIDPKLGDRASGLNVGGKSIKIPRSFIRDLSTILSQKTTRVVFEQEAPWTPGKTLYIAVCNKKGTPMYALAYPSGKGRTVIVYRLIQVTANKHKVRFKFGSESYLYMEITSLPLVKKLQEIGGKISSSTPPKQDRIIQPIIPFE